MHFCSNQSTLCKVFASLQVMMSTSVDQQSADHPHRAIREIKNDCAECTKKLPISIILILSHFESLWSNAAAGRCHTLGLLCGNRI